MTLIELFPNEIENDLIEEELGDWISSLLLVTHFTAGSTVDNNIDTLYNLWKTCVRNGVLEHPKDGRDKLRATMQGMTELNGDDEEWIFSSTDNVQGSTDILPGGDFSPLSTNAAPQSPCAPPTMQFQRSGSTSRQGRLFSRRPDPCHRIRCAS